MRTVAMLMIGAAALGFAVPAQAAPDIWQGLYLKGGVGWSIMSGKADFLNVPDRDLDYQSNALVSAAVGYKWQGWRAEVEPNWVTNDVDVAGFSGGTTMSAILANLAYDYDLGDRWMLTAGFGVGGARVSHNIRSLADNRLLLGGHDMNFAWQALAGVSYELTKSFEVGVEYRFMSTGTTESVSQFAPVRFEDGRNQAVMVNLRWYPFAKEDEPAAASAPPPPAPPPPPRPLMAPSAPPPPVRTFVVFFDFNRSDISQAARVTIEEAVRTVKQNGFARIVVTGHTDRTGKNKYNQKLSERRADAVKSAMVSMGIVGGQITTSGKSFSAPLVPTGPGIREPQNRRAVIDLE